MIEPEAVALVCEAGVTLVGRRARSGLLANQAHEAIHGRTEAISQFGIVATVLLKPDPNAYLLVTRQ